MSILGKAFYSTCGTSVGHACARAAVTGLRSLGGCRGFRMPLDALSLDHASVRELTRLWSRIHWSSGDGMMPPEQLLTIYRLACDCPVEGVTVELGSWVGLTTSYLATACRARGCGKVYAVDTFAGTKEGDTRYPSVARYDGNTLAAFQDQMRRAGVVDLVEPVVGYTHEIASTYSGDPIRFLFIDADHSYDGVRQDFELWYPHVAPGGLIVFHDYLMADVARFIDDDVRSDSRVDFTPGKVVENVVVVTKRVSKIDAPVSSPARPRIEAELVGVAAL